MSANLEGPSTHPASTVTRDAAATLAHLRAGYDSGRTRPREWRLEQLAGLRAMLVEREDELLDALEADIGKPRVEAWAGEIGILVRDVDHARRRLRKWMRPDRVRTPLLAQPGRSRVVREPFGVALIIGPWNYPLYLLVAPLIGALAAGNCAAVKPSELAPRTSAALARWLPRYLDAGCVAVVEGGAEAARELLAQRFDFIFYTGGAAVGRIVLEAAARHLTPAVLELGGKSPCIVDSDVDISVAARRIAWGKFFNAGQTCVAPDYVLVDERREAELLEALRDCTRRFYGDDPRQSRDYARIVNAHHHERLSRLLAGGEVYCGGETDPQRLYFAPTVLHRVRPDAPVMQEEVFGPILPVLCTKTLDDAIAFVRARPKPLAVYLFSRSADSQRRVLDGTSSGGLCVNDVTTHLIVPELPFGGIGPSGMGTYHGRHSFAAFSHQKAVLLRRTRPDFRLRYPPYHPGAIRWLRWLYRL